MKKDKLVEKSLIIIYTIFIIFSLIKGYSPGIKIANNFKIFSLDMLKVLPPVFILIGLFEVWTKRESVQRYLGKKSGYKGYIYAIILASTTVGGLYVAFPVAYSLFKKGAKLSIIFTYVGAAAIARIPMTTFEITFMGIKFTLIRLITSLSLVILSSYLLGNYLEKKNYQVKDGK